MTGKLTGPRVGSVIVKKLGAIVNFGVQYFNHNLYNYNLIISQYPVSLPPGYSVDCDIPKIIFEAIGVI